jgi:hypothetical protein
LLDISGLDVKIAAALYPPCMGYEAEAGSGQTTPRLGVHVLAVISGSRMTVSGGNVHAALPGDTVVVGGIGGLEHNPAFEFFLLAAYPLERFFIILR